jgi:hypothetical protein
MAWRSSTRRFFRDRLLPRRHASREPSSCPRARPLLRGVDYRHQWERSRRRTRTTSPSTCARSSSATTARRRRRTWTRAGCRPPRASTISRATCARSGEPIFDKPLKEIYFGKLLLRLFDVGARHGIEVQPRLALLLKTMLQVEGLGRQLDPDLDLRPHGAADPRALDERADGRWARSSGACARKRREWARTLPQIPRLVHRLLADDAPRGSRRRSCRHRGAQLRQTRVLRLSCPAGTAGCRIFPTLGRRTQKLCGSARLQGQFTPPEVFA